MNYKVFLVNAFCNDKRGGNGAGVVLCSAILERNIKLRIAAEIGYSETIFVREEGGGVFHLEYFTPVEEVDLCGHATIAAFALLLEQGLPQGRYTILTRAGRLYVDVANDGKIFMQQCSPTFHERYTVDIFASCLPVDYYNASLPIQAVSTGLKDILFPIDSVEHLRSITPDFEAMAKLNKQQGVVGIHAFALTKDGDAVAECRNFAPLYGINEESATGTSNCALACYLHRYEKPQTHYRFLQGVTMQQTSAIEVILQFQQETIQEVKVGGYGLTTGMRTVTIESL